MANAISGSTPAGINTSNMDLTDVDPMVALQMLMSEKSTLFGAKITDAVKAMQENNKKIRSLTDASAKLTELKNDFKKTDSNQTYLNNIDNGGKKWREDVSSQADIDTAYKATYSDLVAGNVTFSSETAKARFDSTVPAVKTLVENGLVDETTGKSIIQGGVTYGEITALIEKIKSMSDSLSSDGNLLQIELNRMISLRDNTDQANSSMGKKSADTQSTIINKL